MVLVTLTQVAGDAVRELPTWAGPDVIIAATMSKLDGIVAAASAQVRTSLLAFATPPSGLTVTAPHLSISLVSNQQGWPLQQRWHTISESRMQVRPLKLGSVECLVI